MLAKTGSQYVGGAMCPNGKTSCSYVKRNKTLTNTVVFIETCSVVTFF